MVNVWSMTKKCFCFKTPFFPKNSIFSKIMSQSKDWFWLIQALYISKHISRNGGATIKASRKTVHDKVFLILGQKGHFFQKMAAPSKKVIALNTYIGTNVFSVWKMVGAKSSEHGQPAQRFRHSIDSHCLCMWVNKTMWPNLEYQLIWFWAANRPTYTNVYWYIISPELTWYVSDHNIWSYTNP